MIPIIRFNESNTIIPTTARVHVVVMLISLIKLKPCVTYKIDCRLIIMHRISQLNIHWSRVYRLHKLVVYITAMLKLYCWSIDYLFLMHCGIKMGTNCSKLCTFFYQTVHQRDNNKWAVKPIFQTPFQKMKKKTKNGVCFHLNLSNRFMLLCQIYIVLISLIYFQKILPFLSDVNLDQNQIPNEKLLYSKNLTENHIIFNL